MVPFSNNNAGAVTESIVHLNLRREETNSVEYQDEAEITTRLSLLYNHYPTPKPTHNEIRTSRELLKEMCRIGFPDIQRDFIDIFTKFLQTSRHLSYSALNQLLARAASICTAYGKYVECSGVLAFIIHLFC